MVARWAQVRGELDTARALGSLLLLLLTPRIADLHRHAINLGRDTLPCQYAASLSAADSRSWWGCISDTPNELSPQLASSIGAYALDPQPIRSKIHGGSLPCRTSVITFYELPISSLMMVPGVGVKPTQARGPRDFKATGERHRTKDLANSLPFSVSEESEEGRGVRGLWTPRWTPVAEDVEGGGHGYGYSTGLSLT